MKLKDFDKMIQFLEREQNQIVKSRRVLVRSGADDYHMYLEIINVLKKSVCDTAPYPTCNGAEGCENCDYLPEES